jgi:hypothetical protein
VKRFVEQFQQYFLRGLNLRLFLPHAWFLEQDEKWIELAFLDESLHDDCVPIAEPLKYRVPEVVLEKTNENVEAIWLEDPRHIVEILLNLFTALRLVKCVKSSLIQNHIELPIIIRQVLQ